MGSPYNQITTNEIDFVRNVEFVNRFNGGIEKLLKLIDVNGVQTLPAGAAINIWATIGSLNSTQAAEGEDIPLSKFEHKIAETKSLTFKAYRKSVSLQAIQKGGESAVEKTDRRMIGQVQQGVRGDILAMLEMGTGCQDWQHQAGERHHVQQLDERDAQDLQGDERRGCASPRRPTTDFREPESFRFFFCCHLDAAHPRSAF